MRNKKEIIILLGTIIFQTTIYNIGKLFSSNSHLIHTNLDDNLPFLSFFIVFYVYFDI